MILVLVAPVVVASPIGGLPPVAGASLVASPVVRAGVVLPRVVKAGPPSHIVVVGFVVEFIPGVAPSTADVILGLGEGEAGFNDVVALDDDVDLGRGRGTRLLEGCQFLQALSLSLRMKLDLSVLDWSAE